MNVHAIPYSGALSTECARCRAAATLFCGSFQDQHRQRLEKIGHMVRLERGEYLFHQNAQAVSVYLVKQGMVMLERSNADGKRQVLAFLHPGDFLGFTAGGTHYRYSVYALQSTELCAFRRQPFIDLCNEYPELKNQLGIVNNRALEHAMDHIFTLGNKNAHERLCFFLFNLQQRSGKGGSHQLELCMSRQDIADYLGLTIETVSRAFSRLEREGVVKFINRHLVEFPQPGKLAKLAEAS